MEQTISFETKMHKKSISIEMLLAVWTGLEPATPCVTGRYSNQLNYQTVAVSGCKYNSVFFNSKTFFAKISNNPISLY